MPSSAAGSPPSPVRSLLPLGRSWLLTVGALGVGVVAFTLCSTLLLPLLPAIQTEFATSSAAAGWVVTVFLLVGSVANPVAGRAGDLFGQRRVLLIVLTISLIGAGIALVAPDVRTLIVARAVQGVGGAALPLAFAIIRDRVPEHRRGFAVAFTGSMTAVGGGIGLPVGGLLVDAGSIDDVFRLVCALSAVALVLTLLFVSSSPVVAGGRLDLLGAALLSVWVALPLIALSIGTTERWATPLPPILFAVAVVALLVWLRHERRTTDPLIDLAVVARRPVLLTNAAAFLANFGLFGAFTLIPLIAQAKVVDGGLGLSASAAGLLMLPTATLTFLVAIAIGGMLRRVGPRLPMVGSGLVIAGMLAVVSQTGFTSTGLAATAAVMGLGFGALTATAPNVIIRAVAPTEVGAQTGLTTMVQNLASSCGAQVAVLLLAAGSASTTGTATVHAIGLPLLTCAALVGGAGVVSCFLTLPPPGAPPAEVVAENVVLGLPTTMVEGPA